jgi:hypothetical protein
MYSFCKAKETLEEEKRKLKKGKLDEFEDLIGENKSLREELGKMKLQFAKFAK